MGSWEQHSCSGDLVGAGEQESASELRRGPSLAAEEGGGDQEVPETCLVGGDDDTGRWLRDIGQLEYVSLALGYEAMDVVSNCLQNSLMSFVIVIVG